VRLWPCQIVDQNSSLGRVIATLLVGVGRFSRTLYLAAFIYTFLANAFFLVRALYTFPFVPSHACPSASLIALCGSPRCWCSIRSCWHRLSRTAFAAYHLSLSRRCRAGLVYGCIGPCITCGWHTLMYSPMTGAASLLIALILATQIIKQPITVASHCNSGDVDYCMSACNEQRNP